MGAHSERVNTEMDEQGDKKALPLDDDTIPCVTWELAADPVRLPSLPILPDLHTHGDDDEKPTQLIEIAGLDGHLIGLTNKGHVLKFGNLDSETTSSQGRWEYLPAFSEFERIQIEYRKLDLDSPQTMKITHISANFNHFIVYSTGSSSVVLIGDTSTDVDSDPKVIPELQNKSIISVVLGDYHSVALTAGGKVLTWGDYSAGALGLGDPATLTPGTPGAFDSQERRSVALERSWGRPPRVEVPTEPDTEEDAVTIELEPEDRPLPHSILRGRGRGRHGHAPIIPTSGLEFRYGFAAQRRDQ
ncbi:hypothetical protein H0H81_005088 [Sphagnurus paluster]|uniref:Uncharacterized protein n=1 Tax=Sphagnurus paluster TaxID=117069 RepID=A0A9P7FVZ5_9AGAR|nr:hypothetical protein H0H81_005088 [Sphagnurus paluster]